MNTNKEGLMNKDIRSYPDTPGINQLFFSEKRS